MPRLICILLICLVLAALSEKQYANTDASSLTIYKHTFDIYWFVLSVILILFVGLRTRYNDTATYIYTYNNTVPGLENIKDIGWNIGDNIGYNIIRIVFKSLGVSVQSYLMFYSIITNGIYLWFIRKHSDNRTLTLFFFIAMGVYTFTLAAIKQSVAVAFCLVGVDRALQKKWKNFVFWIVLGVLFHPYSFMYFLTPLFIFKPWTKKTYYLLGIVLLAGLMLRSLLGVLINVTTLMGEEYTTDSFTGDGVNIFRVFVVWVPILLSYLVREQILSEENEKDNLFLNLAFLNAEIMFIGLFGTANYFARLANYFLMFQALALPKLFKLFKYQDGQLLKLASIGCFFIFFYYETNMVYGTFDSHYSSVRLVDYLTSIFS